jgi:hypothetical protein
MATSSSNARRAAIADANVQPGTVNVANSHACGLDFCERAGVQQHVDGLRPRQMSPFDHDRRRAKVEDAPGGIPRLVEGLDSNPR